MPDSRRGAMLVLVAVTLVVLLVAAAFSVDVAYMQLTRTELRSATDAAARAAAEALSRQQSGAAAIAAAKTIAARNTVAGQPLILADEDIVLGRSNISPQGLWEFTAGAAPPNAVRVFGRRTTDSPSGAVPLFLGSIFGVDEFEPRSSSVASQLDRDISLVLDHSGSMRQLGRWAALQRAVNVFILEIERTPQRELVSLIGYADTAQKRQPLTAATSNITPQLARLSPNGRTNIGGGLQLGSDSLRDDLEARPLAVKTIIVMTDGNHNTGTSPLDAARIAKQRGHTVHTITFGAEANATLMQDVARTAGGRYYHAADNAELVRVFREIALTLPVVLSK